MWIIITVIFHPPPSHRFPLHWYSLGGGGGFECSMSLFWVLMGIWTLYWVLVGYRTLLWVLADHRTFYQVLADCQTLFWAHDDFYTLFWVLESICTLYWVLDDRQMPWSWVRLQGSFHDLGSLGVPITYYVQGISCPHLENSPLSIWV